MRMLSKLCTIGLLFTLPGMSQAHVQHAHGQSLLLSLLHPLTAIEHIVGLLLLGCIIYVVKRLQTYRVQASVFCLLGTPVLFSFTTSTAAIVSMDAICLGLLVYLKFSETAPAQCRT